MTKNEKIYTSALKRLYKYIKTHNMRPSAVRNVVLENVCKLHQPFTANQLAEVCAIERISVGTVYNALDTFIKADILRGLQRQSGQTATEYELILETTKHMQYICTKCGRTVDFNDKAIGRLIEERKFSNFVLKQYSLIVYGECRRCKKKQTES